MANATLVKDEPKLCPKCGAVPTILPGLLGGFYVRCNRHGETRVVPTREDAIRLWNRDEYES